PQIAAVVAPFGQVVQVLSDERAECWQAAPDLGVVWTRPECCSQAFSRAVRYEQVDVNEILLEVDAYCAALQKLQEKLTWIFVPTWVLPNHRGFGVLDLHSTSGLARKLMQMNARLIHNLEETPNFIVLDTQKWLSKIGEKAFNPKLWYLAKI